MIYDLAKRFAHVHMPRTAGMAILDTLEPRCPDAVIRRYAGRHTRAYQIRDEVGAATWETLFRFAVVRPPHESIERDWRLTCEAIDALTPAGRPYLVPDWLARLDRVAVHRDFETFVREEWLGEWSGILPGGLWRTLCMDVDGSDLGVEAVPFDELPARWPSICDRIGIERCELAHVNSTKPRPVTRPVTRPLPLLAAVRRHFHDDLPGR